MPRNSKKTKIHNKSVSLWKTAIMSLALTNKTIERYFGFLTKLDNISKKKLIIKLTESIEFKEEKEFDLSSLYGAWEDYRDSDEIIKDLIDSRVDKQDIAAF